MILPIERTTFYKKELLIPLSVYKYLFFKVRDLFNSNYSINKEFNLIAVDGTYNNTNLNNKKGVLETSLNMGYFNIDNCIPIDITFNGIESKNKEILQLKKYITEGNFKHTKNVVLVCDRAYFSHELINFLISQGFYFVIRIRNNSKFINNKEYIKKHITDFNSIRVVSYKNEIKINKKDKDKKDVKLKETIECNIITNLPINKYSDVDLKQIYVSRWSIEVFFKLLKTNFKFEHLKEHNNKNTKEEYSKSYYSILIQIYISYMIKNIYMKYKTVNKKKKKYNKNKYDNKINLSLLLSSMKYIIFNIVKGKLEVNELLILSKTFIKNMNVIKDISNPRTSKIPHTKWYVQGYASYYRYLTLIEALQTGDTSKLNKNLKLQLSNLKLDIK